MTDKIETHGASRPWGWASSYGTLQAVELDSHLADVIESYEHGRLAAERESILKEVVVQLDKLAATTDPTEIATRIHELRRLNAFLFFNGKDQERASYRQCSVRAVRENHVE